MSRITDLLTSDSIAERVRAMGEQITRDFQGEEIILVPVLKGSFMFAADLVRHIDLPVQVEFFGCASYGAGTKSSGVVKITHDLTKPIQGKHVIVVEDIVDTGLTMAYLLDNFRTRRPQSLKVAALLHKPARTQVEVPVDYLGFTIEDVFVVGYGLDFGGLYRNLPYIGVLHPGEPSEEPK